LDVKDEGAQARDKGRKVMPAFFFFQYYTGKGEKAERNNILL